MKSVLENPHIALEKVENEIQLGRIAGPFQYSPISNLRYIYIWRVKFLNTFAIVYKGFYRIFVN
jgi:predicted Mrr-cat superfamily restriction endonuclease